MLHTPPFRGLKPRAAEARQGFIEREQYEATEAARPRLSQGCGRGVQDDRRGGMPAPRLPADGGAEQGERRGAPGASP